MVPDVTPRRVAAGSVLVGGVALVVVVYAIVTHEPANDGGTSVAGLFFAIGLLLALPPLAEAGTLAAVLRWGTPAVWPRRLLSLGAVLGALGASVVLLWPLTSLVPAGIRVPEFLDPTPGLVTGVLALTVVGGLAASGVGVVAQLITEVRGSG
ncbi:hypothetical protein OB920_09365 [Halobacteria archaeon HArc-gm2]|nr:hypothetical protein [Halobacteria archaeon HArc-gm2]